MKKYNLLTAVAMCAGTIFAADMSKSKGEEFSQILDVPKAPVYDLSIGYVSVSDAGDYGRISETDVKGHWGFAHFWDVMYGDVDLGLRADTRFISDPTTVGLPSQLGLVSMDMGWTGRFQDGVGLQVRAYPGMYSDFEQLSSHSFGMPLSIAATLVTTPELAERLGVEIRPGFEKELMPLADVAWMIDDGMRLNVGLPDSRFTYYLGNGWSTHAGFEWCNVTYAIRDSDFNADQITVDDYRLFVGATFRLSDDIQFSGEVGRVFGRSYSFNEDFAPGNSEIDVSAATFVRFTLGGPF